MRMKEAFKICQNKGVKVSKQFLYTYGKKLGFVDCEKHPYEVIEDSFFVWLERASSVVPAGWITLSELKKMLNCSKSKAYSIALRPCVKARKIGLTRGKIYVEKRRIEELVRAGFVSD